MASDIRSATVEIAVEPDRRLDLFNGADLSGWSVDDAFDNPDGPPLFRVEDGCLVTTKDTYGHLVSDRSYRDYLLETEYRLPETGGNGSILVHVSRLRTLRTGSENHFPQSIEVKLRTNDAGDIYCIREDIAVADMERLRPREAGQKWGGDEEDARHIVKLCDAENPAGDWNRLIMRVAGRTIRVWLNGMLVADAFDCTTDRGRISVQAGGDEVVFRQVRLHPLDADLL